MRRKSERNKAKGTPEKKVEKPATRRTTRRRGKLDPANSPEAETTEDNVSSTPFLDDNKESRLQSEEVTNDNQETEKGVSSSDLIKSVLGGDEEDNGSVWKAARADASPGEIPKLKLCRQRNISEASDGSSGKKKSNKWPDSGEGGTEEADSADEPIASSQKMLISEQTDDPSSLPPGQDSNQEVSEYKENLPETTSANLSDDKTNIDQSADSKENLPKTTSCLSEPMYEDDQSSSNQPADNVPLDQPANCEDRVEEPALENINEQQDQENQRNQEIQQNFEGSTHFNTNDVEPQQLIEENSVNNDEIINKENSIVGDEQINEDATSNSVDNDNDKTSIEESNIKQDSVPLENTECEDNATEAVLNLNNESVDNNFEGSQSHLDNEEEEEEEEGEIREETVKEPSPESDSASNAKDDSDTQDLEAKSLEKKHSKRQNRNKYDDSSSDSDTPESDDETKGKESSSVKTTNEKKYSDDAKKSNDTEKESSSVMEPEIELSESNIDKDDILEINDKSDDLNVSLSTSKPPKVSLKRSFSTRLSTDSETKKDENSIRRLSSSETNQNKENHADNEQPDKKNTTKRRRWGTSTSTDVAPAFSISTDSLKALVPGAKPLSVNEVKLTKDEDEKEHRKNKNEITGDHKSKHDSTSKNDSSKKGDKADNHIAKRKVSVVKETPRPKSPSPPEAQATNILLIRNLVRPFTLNQLKELLSRTGTIVENGFWIDRIKSKCFVEYANEDQAFETRQALHGVSWPLSNPKKLIVEYATKEDMEMAQEMSKDEPIVRKTESLNSTDLWHQDQWLREERPTIVNKITVIREWDLGKEDGQVHGKEKERERKDSEKKKRHRSRSPTQEKHLPAPARKFKKKEEDPPTAKLLDDLFKKTKATPCIYWLPLTNDQIMIKEEMRRQHMAEHARRLEDMRRRDTRRRRSPRK